MSVFSFVLKSVRRILGSTHNPKVRVPVIEPVTVDVVNDLAGLGTNDHPMQ